LQKQYGKKNIMTIALLSKPACVQCTATERQFDAANLSYNKEDIYEEGNLTLVKELGYMSAPVVLVRDNGGELVDHWAGFRPDKITELAAALKAA
jgi:glutaredoxin-like protein NrdH